ncbi:MAG: ABC transporter permease [Oenococcus sp.]|uniref:ABC transporter permease n=1 Tax=Oenococcus TaxID=46254 RepID=UPI0021E964C6|nr:ABC transporter permease [Oenococcus kitaharae]MCV3295688.1 ABC transporter permease [Oenococcus kitaharae]
MKAVLAIVSRVILEMRHDKRTIALMFLAPLFILTLMFFLFKTNSDNQTQVGYENLDKTLLRAVQNKNIKLRHYASGRSVKDLIKQNNLSAFINQSGHQLTVTYSNSDLSQTAVVRQSLQVANTKILVAHLTKLIQQAKAQSQLLPGKMSATKQASPQQYKTKSNYLYGSRNSTFFQSFLPVFMGFFVFFFVFLISGISLLTERTSGTLDRLLATPIRRSQIIVGYLIGYGLFACLQTLLIVFYVISVLKVEILGALWLVILIDLLLALIALAMGIFVSTFASSEFQMIQFIPLIVVPQVFFSGLIPVDHMAGWLQAIAHIMPLYYGASALTNVIEKNWQLGDIWQSLAILCLFAVIFIALNIVGMRRYRRV